MGSYVLPQRGTLLSEPAHGYATSKTYSDIASAARRIGVQDPEREMFRRLLVNAYLRNTDDHLRNHALHPRWGRLAALTGIRCCTASFGHQTCLRPSSRYQSRVQPEHRIRELRQFGLSRPKPHRFSLKFMKRPHASRIFSTPEAYLDGPGNALGMLRLAAQTYHVLANLRISELVPPLYNWSHSTERPYLYR